MSAPLVLAGVVGGLVAAAAAKTAAGGVGPTGPVGPAGPAGPAGADGAGGIGGPVEVDAAEFRSAGEYLHFTMPADLPVINAPALWRTPGAAVHVTVNAMGNNQNSAVTLALFIDDGTGAVSLAVSYATVEGEPNCQTVSALCPAAWRYTYQNLSTNAASWHRSIRIVEQSIG